MILINKEEASKIRSSYPDAKITRTCVQKSNRHRYYLPEVYNFLKLIADTNYEAARIISEGKGKRKDSIVF